MYIADKVISIVVQVVRYIMKRRCENRWTGGAAHANEEGRPVGNRVDLFCVVFCNSQFPGPKMHNFYC